MSEHFEEVTMVRTKDGSLFEYASEADAYVVNAVCEDINEIIKGCGTTDLKHRDLVKIIESLCGSIPAIEKLYAILDKHIGG